ncbi:MAG TPA: hypothetical protein VF920_09515, partial [Dongiaceae bacterium]
MLKRYLVLSICLLLGACSWWPWGGDTPEATTPAAKTIGVVSALSNDIRIIDASNGGWSRRSQVYPLQDWKIDAVAQQTAADWLYQQGFDVRPVVAAPAAFGLHALGGPVARGGWFDRHRPTFGTILHSSVQPADLDYYLVLVEASGSTSVPDLHGIGLIRVSGKPKAFVVYHVFLIDGKSGETLDELHADAENEHWGEFSEVDGPHVDLPKSDWPR